MRNSYKDKRVLVVGYGISGQGAVAALHKCGSTVRRIEKTSDKDNYDDIMASVDEVILSPSVPLDSSVCVSARKANKPIIGEIELGSRLNDSDIVAVTGTNGKTTTAQLINKMLAKSGKRIALCGNIGVSFAALAVSDNYDIAVVETSSFQLETIAEFKPKVAIITNIALDHIERHKTRQNYVASKLNIAKNQDERDYLIMNIDEIDAQDLADFCPKAKVIFTSLKRKVDGAYLHNDKLYYFDEPIIRRTSVKLFGEHNLSNCLSAICAAKIMGANNNDIIDTLTSFKVENHRLKFVKRINKQNFYNDSKATNISACLSATRSFSCDTTLIVGGYDKGYEFDDLFLNLPNSVKNVVVFGACRQKIFNSACKCGYFDINIASSLREAVERAVEFKNENVLLSPATSSYDMYKDYSERGEEFEKIVKSIKIEY